QLRRRRAARRRADRAAAAGARVVERSARVRDAARRHPRLLRPREAGALASLPYGRMRRARQQRSARPHRRRRAQLHGRRRHRRGGVHVDPGGGQHGDCRARARDPARSGRLRDPPARRLQPHTRAHLQRARRSRRRRRCRRRVPVSRFDAAHRAVLPVVRDGELSLRRDGRSDSRPASRHVRRQPRAPGAARHRRHRHGPAAVAMPIDAHNLATVQKMWRREVEAAATYRHLAEREKDPKRREILTRLADQEDKHAARWSERIALATGRAPDPTEVERGLSWFQRISDPAVVLHRLEQEETKADAEYGDLMARLSDPTDRQIAEEAMYEERDHAVILRTLAGGAMPTPRSALDTILHRERWHVRGAGWIGDAVYGVNDGLGAVFGIVSGMAGYTGGSEVVLAAGLAGTLASALSMGAGAYLASKSNREVYESEVQRERAEIEEDPHEELLELELFYQLKGFSSEEARSMAERIQKEPKQFLRTLVHEELGLSEETFPNP